MIFANRLASESSRREQSYKPRCRFYNYLWSKNVGRYSRLFPDVYFQKRKETFSAELISNVDLEVCP